MAMLKPATNALLRVALIAMVVLLFAPIAFHGRARGPEAELVGGHGPVWRGAARHGGEPGGLADIAGERESDPDQQVCQRPRQDSNLRPAA